MTLSDPVQPVFVSAASAWEIANKHRPSRLLAAEVLLRAGWPLQKPQFFQPLPVSWRHGVQAGRFPLPHRDPYRSAEDCVIDRLLAGKAEFELPVLLTLNHPLAPLPRQTLWRNPRWPGWKEWPI